MAVEKKRSAISKQDLEGNSSRHLPQKSWNVGSVTGIDEYRLTMAGLLLALLSRG